jgi:quinol monooxygenase YgiN
MHGLLITFRSAATLDQVHDAFMEAAPAISQTPGLISKAWLRDGDHLGGFYVFTDADAAEAYLAGPIIGQVKATPAFSDFAARHFDVLDDLSAVTGTRRAALATS